MKLILSVFSFGIGACIASFLNVVIWRVPRGESIVSPPSHCPKCNAAIKWYQNIPIVSWLALRGRCVSCRAPISPRYILIEMLGGALFLAIFIRFGATLTTLVLWIWAAFAIAGSFIDFDHKLLPDFATVGGMVLGVVFGGAECVLHAPTLSALIPSSLSELLNSYFYLLTSLSGLVFGFSMLGLVRYFGSKAFKREAMGLGDVFLMGAIGALFGPVAVLFALILSSLLGSVVGLSMVAVSKTKIGRLVEIPFGPYLYLASFVWIFWGDSLVRWYLNLLRM